MLKLAAKVHAAIKAKRGMSVEDIGRALRLPTKALKLPVAKLLQAKQVKAKGQKRATRYSAV